MVTLRAAIERLYEGKATITEYQSVKDTVTKVTSKQELVVITDQPCRLSYKASSTAKQTDAQAGIGQEIKLFIAPEIVVKPGSKITVTQHGVTTVWGNSGDPAHHSSHQEILLKLYMESA